MNGGPIPSVSLCSPGRKNAAFTVVTIIATLALAEDGNEVGDEVDRDGEVAPRPARPITQGGGEAEGGSHHIEIEPVTPRQASQSWW